MNNKQIAGLVIAVIVGITVSIIFLMWVTMQNQKFNEALNTALQDPEITKQKQEDYKKCVDILTRDGNQSLIDIICEKYK